jgi:hypothetical protein
MVSKPTLITSIRHDAKTLSKSGIFEKKEINATFG